MYSNVDPCPAFAEVRENAEKTASVCKLSVWIWGQNGTTYLEWMFREPFLLPRHTLMISRQSVDYDKHVMKTYCLVAMTCVFSQCSPFPCFQFVLIVLNCSLLLLLLLLLLK